MIHVVGGLNAVHADDPLALLVLHQLQLQVLDLLPQQQNRSGRLILVGGHLVLDVSGTVSVLEGIEGLHEVPVARGHASDHHCTAVAAE